MLLGTGCSDRRDPDRIDASIIGDAPRLADPDRETLSISRAVIMRETAMGLVALDATGQVEPALAESWIVSDDGLSIIFRIQRMRWPGGDEVTGDEVAASLKRALAASSENRLKPLLSAIEAVVGMTGRVVEIRLKTPRPYLLQLLAQPELGIRKNGTGLGPWRIAGREGTALVLRPSANIAEVAGEETAADRRVVHVEGGRAALATARFLAGQSDIVLGGTAADWPIVQAANIPASRVRLDPAEGLFGLAIYPRTAFLRERGLREALSMAIDRGALASSFSAPRWTSLITLLPAQLDSGQAVAMPAWISLNRDERLATARARVASFVAARGDVPALRVALPPGPGMRLLFARIQADWRQIGLSVQRVGFGAKSADMRLVDEVAPNSSANWYLTRTGCEYGLACSETSTIALTEARKAPTLGQRSAAIARADATLAHDAGYIPLAKPMRWSLVAPDLTGYRDNAFAAHPLMEVHPRFQGN